MAYYKVDKRFGSEDIYSLSCDFKRHVIKGSCDFMGRSPSW